MISIRTPSPTQKEKIGALCKIDLSFYVKASKNDTLGQRLNDAIKDAEKEAKRNIIKFENTKFNKKKLGKKYTYEAIETTQNELMIYEIKDEILNTIIEHKPLNESMIKTIVKVKTIQFYETLLNEMDNNNTPSVSEPKKAEKPEIDRLRWNGTKQSIYVLFYLLKESKFIKSDTDAARFIIQNFETTNGKPFDGKEFETIRKQINSPSSMGGKDTAKINTIINGVIDICKTLETK